MIVAGATSRRIVGLALITLGLLPARPAEKPPLADLLTRAGAHVRRFEQDFELVISDEDYRQRAGGRIYLNPRERRTRSEMLFMWLPDESTWLVVRNVLTVDGRPVPDSQNRLADRLGDTSAGRATRLRRLLDEGARFNLGRIFRNINYPTLALVYLDPAMQRRFVFALADRERISGIDVSKIQYEERERPTIIQEEGADRVSKGAVWIADDGVVVRTRLELTIPLRETIVSVDVDYRRDGRLDMWVPARMHETYLQSRAGMINENIDCVAVYTNFRRFETSGRLIVK